YRLRILEVRVGRHPEFVAEFPAGAQVQLEDGTTGKVVPRGHVEGLLPWREIIKARVRGCTGTVVKGELYFPAGRKAAALKELSVGDYVEIDAFGITSKIESALCEASLFQLATSLGFAATRMPENVAKHVGTQNYFDFRLERAGAVYRVELKSLWGTDTTKARLIHTVSREGGGKNSSRTDRQVWSTSSCRFIDQDIFAVSLWLRTGRVTDFAFAVSAPDAQHQEWGLPRVPRHPGHVTQNPPISDPPAGRWTTDLNEVCQRVDRLRV
ncbi:MAG: hypothetical protein ABL986_24240, partial [Vicinamibacterales bacterium]